MTNSIYQTSFEEKEKHYTSMPGIVKDSLLKSNTMVIERFLGMLLLGV